MSVIHNDFIYYFESDERDTSVLPPTDNPCDKETNDLQTILREINARRSPYEPNEHMSAQDDDSFEKESLFLHQDEEQLNWNDDGDQEFDGE